MNQMVVDAYVAELNAALGDEFTFSALMARLETDARVRQPEAAAICKVFYGDASSSLSKREAFRRIWSRQNSLLDFKAKSRAQAGRSAA